MGDAAAAAGVLALGILNTDMKSSVDFGDGFVYMRVD
jgi:hypothetical protein